MDFLRALEAFFRHNCDNAMPIESNWHILPRIALSKSHQISSATCKAVWFSNLKLKATTCASESLPKCNSSQDVTRCHKMSQDVARCQSKSLHKRRVLQDAATNRAWRRLRRRDWQFRDSHIACIKLYPFQIHIAFKNHWNYFKVSSPLKKASQ